MTRHLKRILKGEIIWAIGIKGGSVLSTHGGDFELHIDQDPSTGCQSDTDKVVHLYLRESLTFLMVTSEALVSAGLPQ